MKQRLTSLDEPLAIPAYDLDLSHAIKSFRPGSYCNDDIPDIPVIRKNGKFKTYKRIVSLPILKSIPSYKSTLKDKALPSPPLASPLEASFNSLFTASETSMPPSPVNSLTNADSINSSDTNITHHTPINIKKRSVTIQPNYRYSMPPLLENDYEVFDSAFEPDTLKIINNDRKRHSRRFSGTSSGSVTPSKTSVDFEDIDSLFSSGHKSNQTLDSDYAAKSLLEVVEIYNNDSGSFEDLTALVSQPTSPSPTTTAQNVQQNVQGYDSIHDYVYNNSDDELDEATEGTSDFDEDESTYTFKTAFSNITSKYIDENNFQPNNQDEILSIADSLFSSSSFEEPKIEIIGINGSKTFSHGSKHEISTSTLSLNKDLPPSPTDSIQPETSLTLKNKNTSSTSVQKETDLNVKPLVVKKSRVNFGTSKNNNTEPIGIRHRNSYSRPVSMYDQRPVSMGLDAYRGVSNERSLNEKPIRPVSMISPSNFSNLSTSSFVTSISLMDAKSDLKKSVRTRPFSYCLDNGTDYDYSRFASLTQPIKSVGNPYNNSVPKHTETSSKTRITSLPNLPASSSSESPSLLKPSPKISIPSKIPYRSSYQGNTLTPQSPETPMTPRTPVTPNTPMTPSFNSTSNISKGPTKSTTPHKLSPIRTESRKIDYFRSCSQPSKIPSYYDDNNKHKNVSNRPINKDHDEKLWRERISSQPTKIPSLYPQNKQSTPDSEKKSFRNGIKNSLRRSSWGFSNKNTEETVELPNDETIKYTIANYLTKEKREKNNFNKLYY